MVRGTHPAEYPPDPGDTIIVRQRKCLNGEKRHLRCGVALHADCGDDDCIRAEQEPPLRRGLFGTTVPTPETRHTQCFIRCQRRSKANCRPMRGSDRSRPPDSGGYSSIDNAGPATRTRRRTHLAHLLPVQHPAAHAPPVSHSGGLFTVRLPKQSSFRLIPLAYAPRTCMTFSKGPVAGAAETIAVDSRHESIKAIRRACIQMGLAIASPRDEGYRHRRLPSHRFSARDHNATEPHHVLGGTQFVARSIAKQWSVS